MSGLVRAQANGAAESAVGAATVASSELEKRQITVVIGCIVHNRRILLSQRFEPELPDADGKWDLPGGTVEFGEHPADAVRREIFEETGLDVEPVKLIPYAHTNVWRYEKYSLSVILLGYLCRIVGGRTKTSFEPSEVRRLRWVDFEEVDLGNALPGIGEFVSQAVASQL
ncbi:MAG: NUDIX domain-containing protein [Roseiarcus sp.]|jgi:8-oxo-dGTP pyrophosphatase MutT (NUDIX family)